MKILSLFALTLIFLLNEQPTQEQLDQGKEIYLSECAECHNLNGEGVPGTYPPLSDKNDFVGDNGKVIFGSIYFGNEGEMTVNSELYNGIMDPVEMSAEDAALVVTYIMNSWGNAGGVYTAEDAASVRETEETR